MEIRDSENVTVNGNHLPSGGTGIRAVDSSGVNIVNNTIANVKETAIYLSQTTNSTIENNNIGSLHTCVQLEDSDHNLIRRNEFKGFAGGVQSGIQLTGRNTTGIYFEGVEDTDIELILHRFKVKLDCLFDVFQCLIDCVPLADAARE